MLHSKNINKIFGDHERIVRIWQYAKLTHFTTVGVGPSAEAGRIPTSDATCMHACMIINSLLRVIVEVKASIARTIERRMFKASAGNVRVRQSALLSDNPSPQHTHPNRAFF